MLASNRLQRNESSQQAGMSRDQSAQIRLLKQRLADFMDEARKNEHKLRRFQSLELKLVSLNSLLELIEAILRPDPGAVNWDMVSLLLFDPEYEVQRILKDEGVKLEQMPSLMFATSLEEMEELYSTSLFPTLGGYRSSKHAKLFQHANKKPASVVLLPLVRYGRLIGSLNIGSHNADKFVRGVRTDFLEHFAAVVAICVENGINLERLKRQGLTDTLTAINNRRFFDQRLKEEVESACRSGKPLSCMLLDVDHFKRVNDTYGHQVGDLVLREMAAIIRAQLRGSDVLSRYGGEEFSALLGNTGSEEAEEVAERIRRSVEDRIFNVPDFDPFNITISIGVATLQAAPNTLLEKNSGDVLIGMADRMLYDAKAEGRNQVCIAPASCSLGTAPRA
jgi:two-component system cell cycle response regulator